MDVLKIFERSFENLKKIEDSLTLELEQELRAGGVKKDYFLSYNQRKDRILDLSKDILLECLELDFEDLEESEEEEN